MTFTATTEDHFPDCLKDSLLYWTPLAKRRCKLWFMDCRPAGMGLSLSCPGSDPTSFLSAENILTRLHKLAQQHVVAQRNLPDNSPNNDWRRCVKKVYPNGYGILGSMLTSKFDAKSLNIGFEFSRGSLKSDLFSLGSWAGGYHVVVSVICGKTEDENELIFPFKLQAR